jgi:5S rRNA maturation endonuclease (ribonuclease M5)
MRKKRQIYKEATLDEVEKVIRLLREKSAAGVPIIIEGKKDEIALTRLGINGNFFKISAHKMSLAMLAEKISTQSSEAIILTDFDHHGSFLVKKLVPLLEYYRVRYDLQIRRRLKFLLRIGRIEEIFSHLVSVGRSELFSF